METTSARLTPDEIEKYRKTALRRQKEKQAQTAHLRERAWETARLAAKALRERYHATRVVVFGSLIHEGCFTRWSDVDMAAWGIPPEDTFRAMGSVADISNEVVLSLVDINLARPSLIAVVEKEGIDV